MVLSPKQQLVAAGGIAAGLALSFGAGRFSAPTKTQTITEERVVEKVVYRDRVVRVAGPVVVRERRVEVPGPAGPTVTVERVVERGPTTTVSDTVKDTVKDTEAKSVVTVEHDVGRFTALGTLGMDVTRPGTLVYGGQLTARVLGPVTIGLGFDSSLRATALVGVSW